MTTADQGKDGGVKKGDGKPVDKKKDAEKKTETLSEEDLELKERLEGKVTAAIGEPKYEGAQNPTLQERIDAIEYLRQEVRTASASVTAIPKALKFLGKHYDRLKEAYNQERQSAKLGADKSRLLSDVLSVIAMAYGDADKTACESLRFRLEGSSNAEGDAITRGARIDLEPWGPEYVRSLMGEVTRSWQAHEVDASKEPKADVVFEKDQLEQLVDSIVPFQLKHSSEPDAVDLLLEVDMLHKLSEHVDEHNYSRVCLYLLSSCHFLPPPDDQMVLECAYKLYSKVAQHANASIVAIKMNNVSFLQDSFKACSDSKEDAFLLQCQVAYIAAGSGHGSDLTQLIEDMSYSDAERETLEEIVSNSKLSEHFLNVARDLDVMEAKTPEDVYKQHLVETRGSGAVDTAKQHLASAFVNGLVNAGFCKDKLVCDDQDQDEDEDASSSKTNKNLIFKNKEHGKVSATASIGLISLWDVDGGLPLVDKYLYSKDMHILAGSLLAVGAICAGTQSDCDPALALLAEHLSPGGDEDAGVAPGNLTSRMAAILGLGLAYAGNARPAVRELLIPLVTDDTQPLDVAGYGCLSLGLIHAGTANDEAVQTILQVFMMRGGEMDVKKVNARLACIGLALLFMRKGDEADAVLEVVKTFNEGIAQYCQIVVETMAYTSTGNVLKVQQMLGAICDMSESADKAAADDGDSKENAAGGDKSKSDKDSKEQQPGGSPADDSANAGPKMDPFTVLKMKEQSTFAAVLSISLISLAEDVGMSMAHRNLEHILQFGDKAARRAVPLAYAALRVSDPEVSLLDTLGRLTHDSDIGVAQNAILALGIMGAGTNHARIATMLRSLSGFYCKDSSTLFLVRVAQGLVHLGKGLVTLAPHRADRSLVSNVSLASISILLLLCSDLKSSILGDKHYLLYTLVPAMRPRFVVTLEQKKDEPSTLQPVPITCHVGTAVDVVGQAGKPKTITGFQTHNTPVLLGVGERVELSNDKYVSLAPVIEGFVITKENPDFVE